MTDTNLQTFQFNDKYKKFPSETWEEAVLRTTNTLYEITNSRLPLSLLENMHGAILNKEIAPSMRLFQMAGPYVHENNISIYNCSARVIDDLMAFRDAVIVSMSGCGFGYSVESKWINELPKVQKQHSSETQNFEEFLWSFNKTAYIPLCIEYAPNKTLHIDDSMEGWADAIYIGINLWINGYDINFNYSNIRTEGSKLKRKGGYSSGSKVLEICLNNIREIILNRQGKKLRAIDVHDIICNIGECSISGGVRRCALIALFDYNDEEMLYCKTGNNFPQTRWNCNITAVVPNNCSEKEYNNLLNILFSNGNGEPGLYNRLSVLKNMPIRRQQYLLNKYDCNTLEELSNIIPLLLNPCGEINLLLKQFCNLTSVIVRENDTKESLIKKSKLATVVGVIQSLATNFELLDKEWISNCEEERLLGVDLNGMWDSPLLLNDNGKLRYQLKNVINETALEISRFFNINCPTATTACKPNGNSSVLFNTSSGANPRLSKIIRRNVRINPSTPVFNFFKEIEYPIFSIDNGDYGKIHYTSFYQIGPEHTKNIKDISALELLEFWKLNKLFYTEHNPSITIYYDENEIQDIKDWVFKNKNIITGITFFPWNDNTYIYNPVEMIESEEDINQEILNFNINWNKLHNESNIGSACEGALCEIQI